MTRQRSSLLLAAALCCLVAAGQAPGPATPDSLGRVLITNDDGIDTPGLRALATAFATAADQVIVVAPEGQRSGSGMTSAVLGEGELTVRPAPFEGGIEAYAVNGYPVDCVLFAREVLFDSEGPDLVVSGINTSPNLGGAFFLSGTVGAARQARQLGIPALAVSGGSPTVPGQLEAAARYAVALARSDAFRSLGPDEYLTLDVPMVPPSEFRGVRVAFHQPDLVMRFDPPEPPQDGPTTYGSAFHLGDTPTPGSDLELYRAGWLVIVPMTVGQQVASRIGAWRAAPGTIPSLDEILAPGGARRR